MHMLWCNVLSYDVMLGLGANSQGMLPRAHGAQ